MNLIALDFIKAHEGCRLKAYQDSAGVWTAGYGATGPDIHSDTEWTQPQADARLVSDMAQSEAAVRRLVTVPLSDRQHAALTSFCFNLGQGALKDSTLLVRLNQRDFFGAAKEFSRWDRADGREMKGLLIRRFDEASLFLQGS